MKYGRIAVVALAAGALSLAQERARASVLDGQTITVESVVGSLYSGYSPANCGGGTQTVSGTANFAISSSTAASPFCWMLPGDSITVGDTGPKDGEIDVNLVPGENFGRLDTLWLYFTLSGTQTWSDYNYAITEAINIDLVAVDVINPQTILFLLGYTDAGSYGTTVYANGVVTYEPSTDLYLADYYGGTDVITFVNKGDTADLPPPAPLGVPEPASLALLGSGLVGFALSRRRKRSAV